MAVNRNRLMFAFFVDAAFDVGYIAFMETLTREQVVEMVRRKKGSKSLRQFGAVMDMSAAYLSDVIRGNREPGPRILKKLKLRKVRTVKVVYERISVTQGR